MIYYPSSCSQQVLGSLCTPSSGQFSVLRNWKHCLSKIEGLELRDHRTMIITFSHIQPSGDGQNIFLIAGAKSRSGWVFAFAFSTDLVLGHRAAYKFHSSTAVLSPTERTLPTPVGSRTLHHDDDRHKCASIPLQYHARELVCHHLCNIARSIPPLSRKHPSALFHGADRARSQAVTFLEEVCMDDMVGKIWLVSI